MKTKVALVTGSSKGIGAAIAAKYEACGYTVIRNGRTNLNSQTNFIEADVSTIEGRSTIYNYIQSNYGYLDVLINNAAWTKFVEHSNLQGLSVDDFDKIMTTNVTAPFMLIQQLHPIMNSSGSIINIASVAGTLAQGSNVAYCASKSALITMTRSLARVLGPIRVNSISPGLTLTDFVTFPGNYIQDVVNQTPLQKAGQPEDIADVVVSVTEHMNHITGQDFIVDGGKVLN